MTTRRTPHNRLKMTRAGLVANRAKIGRGPPRYQIPLGGAIRRYHPPLVLSQISRGFYVRDDEAKSYSANGEPPAGLSEAENGV